MSPPSAGFSILITSAPRSANCIEPYGPAPYCSTAITRKPESGGVCICDTVRYIVIRRCPMPDGATSSTPVSLRVPADVIEKLDKVAIFYQRSRSWVMLRALRQYLAEEGQEALDCLESIAEIERGEYHTLEEVLADMDQ